MRVLFYTDSPFFSGAENMISTLLGDEDFVRDHDARFAFRSSPEFDAGVAERLSTNAPLLPLDLLDVPAATSALPSSLRVAGKAVAYLTGAKYRYLGENTRRLEALIREQQPDVLHINSGGYPGAYSTLSAAIAARRAGVPHVVYVANNIATGYTWRRVFDRRIDRAVVAAVEVFVTGSRFAGDALANVLDLPSGQYRTIPNGIRERRIVEQREDVLERIGAPAGRYLAAVVANLERRKGHIHLIRALESLKAQGVTALPWLAIEGVGPEEGALREYVSAHGLAADVAFLGREARVFDLMNAVDVIVLPSIANEDFPNVVLEAMSLSKPVIASEIAGTPEQIIDGETGLLVPPGDPTGLAAAVSSLAHDPEYGVRLGATGRERFESCFAAAHAIDAYRALYRELDG